MEDGRFASGLFSKEATTGDQGEGLRLEVASAQKLRKKRGDMVIPAL